MTEDITRITRPLDTVEIRILGGLMEKQQATPEYYPMTVNSLVAACNQKSNREPVTEYTEPEVRAALDRLQDSKLVWQILGSRVPRWEHNLDRIWQISPQQKALLTVLFLRGPQTAGELRGRTDRLHAFANVDEVEQILRDLARESAPLVREQARRPGQKETRWAHLVGLEVPEEASVPEERRPSEPLLSRLERLEARVDELVIELSRLKERLGE